MTGVYTALRIPSGRSAISGRAGEHVSAPDKTADHVLAGKNGIHILDT